MILIREKEKNCWIEESGGQGVRSACSDDGDARGTLTTRILSGGDGRLGTASLVVAPARLYIQKASGMPTRLRTAR